MSDMRNDEAVQTAVMNLFVGCVPERRAELEAMAKDLQLEFQVHDDNHEDGKFIFDAGAYRYVRFNPRSMRLFWLGAYIAWEGYCATPMQLGQTADLSRFAAMLDTFEEILDADDPESVAWPAGVPEPGAYPGKDADAQGQAAAELATIATGWGLLHETRHARHQQEGTATNPDDNSPDEVRAEENSCDAFATAFLTERIGAYATQTGAAEDQVWRKRQLGIYMGLFTIALVGKDNWQTTNTHPALADRLAAAKAVFGGHRSDQSDEVAALAFQALGAVWPGAPGF